MKYSNWLGVLAVIVLIVSSTLNWAWYPDIKQYFTGFYSLDNMYGKPGKVFIFMGAVATAFYLVPKAWAKRWNLLICGLIVAYAVKTFILFSACYRGICPDRQPGIWIMLFATVTMLVAALLPYGKLKAEPASDKAGDEIRKARSKDSGTPNP